MTAPTYLVSPLTTNNPTITRLIERSDSLRSPEAMKAPSVSLNIFIKPEAGVEPGETGLAFAPKSVRKTGSTTARIRALAAENSRLAKVENTTSFHAGRTKGNMVRARRRTVKSAAFVGDDMKISD
jgi:hypothetical protein